MAITKEKKKEILEKVRTAVDGAQSVVFVNFNGLNVSDTTELRSVLRNEGVGYTVAKKTLIGRALDNKDIKGERPEFEGELAIAYGEDLLAPAREIHTFSKKHKDNIAILGGIFEGEYKSKDEMLAIATIPPLQTLRAQFVNVINSPIQGFVMAVNAIADKKEA